ncbi:MAG: nucleotide exchange factor GrpE [Spirochaetota bacterium]
MSGENSREKDTHIDNEIQEETAEAVIEETDVRGKVVDEGNERGEKEELTRRINELEEENSSLKDQYLRKQADFENFRKRMLRDKEDAIKYANTSLLSDIITIIDDFERAIKAGADAQDVESFRTGIELIEKQFVGMLERKYGLTRFDSEGEEFDPDKHEAITTEPSTEHQEQVVLEDYQKGYMLHDRVLRHAKVKVSIPVDAEQEE